MIDLSRALADALGPAYRLERELGGGGMSRVFLAEEVALGRRVVVKALPPDLVASFNAERFRREIQLAAQLQHPGIVPLLSTGAAGELLWYVMPYVEGQSLREKLARGGAFAVEEAVRIWRDVLEALEYAHKRGIIHRDIKPENVMLSERHAVVLDFGVAKAVTAATGATGATGANTTGLGVAIGTPAYMAPEQVAGEGGADGRLDLYAAGVLMYEMLAGRGPFDVTTPRELMAAHVARPPVPLAARRSGVPTPLADLVMQCLAKEPAERPASATAVLQALDGFAGVISGARTPPSGTAAVPGASPARPRWMAPIAIGAALALVAAGGAVLARGRSGDAPEAVPNTGVLPDSLRLSVLMLPGSYDAADSILAHNLAEALLAAMQSDRRVAPISESRARNLALEAGIAPGAVSRDTLVDLARDLGIHATLSTSVARAGNGFLVSAESRAMAQDSVLVRAEQTANDVAAIPAALRALAGTVKDQLAAAAGRVPRATASGRFFNTTPEAARLLSLAEDALDRGDNLRAAELLREATREDSTFANAWAALSAALGNAGIHPDEQFRATSAAYRWRDRIRSPWARSLAAASYLRAVGRYDESIRVAQAGALPDRGAWSGLSENAIALGYAATRRLDAARRYYALGRDSSYRTPNVVNRNYLVTLLNQGDVEEATRELRRTESLAPAGHPVRLRMRVEYDFATRDVAGAKAAALALHAAAKSESQRLIGKNQLANALLASGQLDSAYRVGLLRERILTDARDTTNILVGEAVNALTRHEFLGQPGQGARLVALLRDGRWARLAVLDRPYPTMIRALAATGELTEANRLLAEWRAGTRPELARVEGWRQAQAQGEILLAEKKPLDALKAFRAGDSSSCIPCAWPYYALAFDAAGQADSAVYWYEKYLGSTSPALGINTGMHPRLLARAYRRLGELYEATGRPRQALQRYGDFTTLWKDADPALQPVVRQARERMAKLEKEVR